MVAMETKKMQGLTYGTVTNKVRRVCYSCVPTSFGSLLFYPFSFARGGLHLSTKGLNGGSGGIRQNVIPSACL